VPDKEIWTTKQHLKTKLVGFIKERLNETWLKRSEDPKHIVAINDTLNDKVLTIGFARRFATYKRAHLLFRNLDRLAAIVNNEQHPVQFLFAGKAHPRDKAGQDLIKYIIDISKQPRFMGKIIFLQNYDIDLAKYLVQGVDIWMNTPTRPLEASGTSGEKAIMNGTLHFSVLDGWWVEGYKQDAGWALPMEQTYENNHHQDDLDAETIYSIIENQISPDYYRRNKEGYSERWVGFIKNCFTQVSPEFTTIRMMNDYFDRFYNKLFDRSKLMKSNNYALPEELNVWKKKLIKNWENIEIIDYSLTDGNTTNLFVNSKYNSWVKLRLNGLEPQDVGVQMVLTDSNHNFLERCDMTFDRIENGMVIYICNKQIPMAGSFRLAVRIHPNHPQLPYQQDLNLMKWL